MGTGFAIHVGTTLVLEVKPHVKPTDLPRLAAQDSHNPIFQPAGCEALVAACSTLFQSNAYTAPLLCKALFFVAVERMFAGSHPRAPLTNFGTTANPAAARAKIDACLKCNKDQRLAREGVDMDKPTPKVPWWYSVCVCLLFPHLCSHCLLLGDSSGDWHTRCVETWCWRACRTR